jgi:hypothetical protein
MSSPISTYNEIKWGEPKNVFDCRFSYRSPQKHTDVSLLMISLVPSDAPQDAIQIVNYVELKNGFHHRFVGRPNPTKEELQQATEMARIVQELGITPTHRDHYLMVDVAAACTATPDDIDFSAATEEQNLWEGVSWKQVDDKWLHVRVTEGDNNQLHQLTGNIEKAPIVMLIGHGDKNTVGQFTQQSIVSLLTKLKCSVVFFCNCYLDQVIYIHIYFLCFFFCLLIIVTVRTCGSNRID